MSKIPIKNIKGDKLGDIEFPDELLVPNKGSQAIHDVIVAYQAGIREPVASTKNKREVSGSNRKPWQQKGSGRARAGYRQSPLWRGGSVVFGPRAHTFAKKVSKKTVRLAFRRALSEKILSHSIRVIDGITLEKPKTKAMVNILRNLKVGNKSLLVLAETDQNVYRASSNLPDLDVVQAANVNVYQLFRYPVVIVTKSALSVLQNRIKEPERRTK